MDTTISKTKERIGESSLPVFDSLTSPYLMNDTQILRFMRMTLLRSATEGNAVLACVDEGCGKTEDLIAMMSIADGLIEIEIDADKRLFDRSRSFEVNTRRIYCPLVLPIRPDLRRALWL